MNQEQFNFVWGECIKPSIDECVSVLSNQEKIKYDVEIKDEDELKVNILKDYESSRKFIIKDCLFYDAEREIIIDYHKIGACLCHSLIKNEVVYSKIPNEKNFKLFMINYIIAFSSSVALMFFALRCRYEKSGEADKLRILEKNGNIFFPDTFDSTPDSYNECIIKMLGLNNWNLDEFDLLSFANILFFLEKYTDITITQQLA